MKPTLISPSRMTGLALTPVECSWIGELIEGDMKEWGGGDDVISKRRAKQILEMLAEGGAK